MSLHNWYNRTQSYTKPLNIHTEISSAIFVYSNFNIIKKLKSFFVCKELLGSFCLSFPFFPFLCFATLSFLSVFLSKMNDWTYVISKSQLKAEKAAKKAMEIEIANKRAEAAMNAAKFYKAVQPFKDAIATSTIDLSNSVDKNGYPRPVEMVWPTVEKKKSPLLSEARGSTNGSDLVPFYLDEFPRFVKFLSAYTVPIYDIEFEEHTDMGYVDGREGRSPYTDSVTVKILTFAAKNVPVIHVYDMYVYRVAKKNVRCNYSYSYIPSLTAEYEWKFDEDYDCWDDNSWIHLASLNSSASQ